MADFIITEGAAVGPLPDNDPPFVYGADDDMFRDCPVITKTRAISVPKDVCATIAWEFRNKDGSVIDLSYYIANADGPWGENSSTTTPNPSGQVIFRFKEALCNSNVVHQAVGWGYDVQNGVLRVNLPATLVQEANLYRMEVAITDDFDDGDLKLVDKGILSVERGLFVTVSSVDSFKGPLTLGELRMYLRDSMVENDLLDDVEFSESEILHAMIRPIQEWNERPPTVAIYDGRTFPFRYFWTQATIAELLMIASHWYRRNQLQASHGGVQVDDKNKANPYIQVAQMMREDWKQWMRDKKLEINLALANGSVGSIYGGSW